MPKSVEEARGALMHAAFEKEHEGDYWATHDAAQDLIDATRQHDVHTLLAAVECDPEIGTAALIAKIAEQVPSE